MIVHRNGSTQLTAQQSISFIKANSALEGQSLSFTDIIYTAFKLTPLFTSLYFQICTPQQLKLKEGNIL